MHSRLLDSLVYIGGVFLSVTLQLTVERKMLKNHMYIGFIQKSTDKH